MTPLERKMAARRLADQELERYLGLRKVDLTRDQISPRRYSRQDIEDLEAERVPWRKSRRD